MSVHEVADDHDGQQLEELSSSGLDSSLAATEDVPRQSENSQQRDAVSSCQTAQATTTFFGLAQDSRTKGFSRPASNDDYAARFPEDPYGQETAPNARAWRVYVEEAAAFDENMVGQSRDGLDVMLVFAGLFSAVVTSFLVQVSQNLQADFSEVSALLLHDLLIVQLSIANGATVNITTPSVNPTQTFDPDPIDVWINGLWVVSLVTSLVVALSAVLVKQWLHRYMTFPSGTPGLRSHVRQFRFMGLEKWRVRIIIGILPIVMHISLILFFAGLTLFYVPLRASLAWTVGTITVLVCVLYLISNTIPIIYPQCPYQTPLTDFIHHVAQVVPFAIQPIQHYCSVMCRGILERAVPSQQRSFMPSEYESESELGPNMSQTNFQSLTQVESDAVRGAHDTLCVDALNWLYQVSSNPTVHNIVLQGISGLPAESGSYAITKWTAATDMQSRRLQLVQEATQTLDSRSPDYPGQLWVVERLYRSSLFLPVGFVQLPHRIDILLNRDSNGWDPRIEAGIGFALGPPFYNHIGFFIRHSEVRMHPLVWEGRVHLVLHQLNPHARRVQGNLGSLLVRFLSLVISPSFPTSRSGSLMTGPQVVWTRLQSQFWDRILETSLLAPYDSVPGGSPISSYHRTLIAAGTLALSHIQQYRYQDTKVEERLCEFLAHVAEKLIIGPNTEPYRTVNCDFLISVLKEFRDVSLSSNLILESEHGNNPLLLCLHEIPWYYLQCSCMPEFHFPCLDFLLHTWANVYDSIQYDSDFTLTRLSDLVIPMAIMAKALPHGHEDAYRICVEEGWMRIVFTEWAICGGTAGTLYLHLIGGYIEGLRTLTLLSNRRRFCGYLHQPQQLTIACMLMVATGVDPMVKGFSRLKDHVVKLAKICPMHTSWSNCCAALEAILTWAQTPRPEISLFPWPPSLQSLNTTQAFRKHPLVEWTARRFAVPDMRENLKVALDALHAVLENAEQVDGVLMPDLENQNECTTQRQVRDEPSTDES